MKQNYHRYSVHSKNLHMIGARSSPKFAAIRMTKQVVNIPI